MTLLENDLSALAERWVTDRDLYEGISAAGEPLRPQNIVVFCRTRLREQDYAGTVHHRYVLILFLERGGTVFLQRQRICASAGQALLVCPFEQHYYAIPEGSLRWLFVTFELPPEQRFALPHPCRTLTEGMRGVLRECLEAYGRKDAGGCALSLALLLHALGQMPASSGKKTLGVDEAPSLAEQVNGYIHDHVGEGFGLGDIARHCGLSSSHLRRRFREVLGVSLGHYIHRIRIDRARGLLRTTGRTVDEIARDCGFASSAAFCRAFRQQAGRTPGAYRREVDPAKVSAASEGT